MILAFYLGATPGPSRFASALFNRLQNGFNFLTAEYMKYAEFQQDVCFLSVYSAYSAVSSEPDSEFGLRTSFGLRPSAFGFRSTYSTN
jgi:hypothetical protein